MNREIITKQCLSKQTVGGKKNNTSFDWQSVVLLEKAATGLFTKIILQIRDQWTTAAILIMKHFADYLGQAELKRPNKYS